MISAEKLADIVGCPKIFAMTCLAAIDEEVFRQRKRLGIRPENIEDDSVIMTCYQVWRLGLEFRKDVVIMFIERGNKWRVAMEVSLNGVITLLSRVCDYVNYDVVYENDEFEVCDGPNGYLRHIKKAKDRGKFLCGYCVCAIGNNYISTIADGPFLREYLKNVEAKSHYIGEKNAQRVKEELMALNRSRIILCAVRSAAKKILPKAIGTMANKLRDEIRPVAKAAVENIKNTGGVNTGVTQNVVNVPCEVSQNSSQNTVRGGDAQINVAKTIDDVESIEDVSMPSDDLIDESQF